MMPTCNGCVGGKTTSNEATGEVAFVSWLSKRLENERATMHRYLEERHAAVMRAALSRSWLSAENDDAGVTVATWVEPIATPVLPSMPVRGDEGLERAMHSVGQRTSPPQVAVKHHAEQKLTEARTLAANTEAAQVERTGVPNVGSGSKEVTKHRCAERADMDPVRNSNLQDVDRNSVDRNSVQSKQRRYKNKNLQAIAGQDGYEVEDHCGRNIFKDIVRSKKFEIASIFLIFLQAILMCMELQYKGLEWGYDLGLDRYPRHGEDEWPWAQEFFEIGHRCITILFTAEVVFRMLGKRKAYLYNKWSFFDCVLLTFMWLEATELINFSTSYFRLLRLLLIARTAQFMMAVSGFDTLFLLVKSLKAGLGAMLWSFTLLLILQCAVGLFISQILSEVIEDDSYDEDVRVQVFKYFGTFVRTLLTMFEISLSNWVPSCRFFMDNVSDSFAFFYIIYQNMICFAVIRIIAAIFICETNRIASADDTVAMHRRSQNHALQISKLKALFHELDDTGDGYLQWEEFRSMVEDKLLQAWAHSIEVNTSASELEELFVALDDGDGKVSMDEFIDGMLNHRGQARSVDVLALRTAARKMEQLLEQITGQKPAPLHHDLLHAGLEAPDTAGSMAACVENI